MAAASVMPLEVCEKWSFSRGSNDPIVSTRVYSDSECYLQHLDNVGGSYHGVGHRATVSKCIQFPAEFGEFSCFVRLCR